MNGALEILSRFQIFGGVLVGALGWFASKYFEGRGARQKRRLERLDRQIRDFYGPLFAEVTARDAIWQSYLRSAGPELGQAVQQGGDVGDGAFASDEERTRWRRWVRDVFMPINLRIEKILMEKSDLLDGTSYPTCYRDVLAHVASYRVLMMEWEAGDLSRSVAGAAWPEEITQVVTDGLKKTQAAQRKVSAGVGFL